jgi:hypothetical protein
MASGTEQSLQKKTVKELQALLRAAKLSPYGLKHVLVDRLMSAQLHGTPPPQSVVVPVASPARKSSPHRQPAVVPGASPGRRNPQVQPEPDFDIIGITYTDFGTPDPPVGPLRDRPILGLELFDWGIDQDLVNLDMMTPAQMALNTEMRVLNSNVDLDEDEYEVQRAHIIQREDDLRRRDAAWMDFDYDYFRAQILENRPQQIVIGGLFGIGPRDLMNARIHIQSRTKRPLNLLDLLLAVHEYAKYFYELAEARGYQDTIYERHRLWAGVTLRGTVTLNNKPVPYYDVNLD